MEIGIRADGVGKGELTVSAYGEESQLLDGERREATIAPHGRTLSNTVSVAHAQKDARPGQKIIDSKIALMQTFRADTVATGPAIMTIAATDSTPAMYRATAEYAVPWSGSLRSTAER